MWSTRRSDAVESTVLCAHPPASERLAGSKPHLLLGLGGELPDAQTRRLFAGVGMIRAEYLLRGCKHYFGTATAERALSSYLTEVSEAFAPFPVWYRTADFESREINVLTGADAIVWEENPLLGARGIRRAILHPRAFEIELSVFSSVARDHPNLRLLFSYLGTPEEARFAAHHARAAGYGGEIGVMVEVPAAALLANEILAGDVSHVTIGLNDLRSLTYGVARARAPSGFRAPLDRLIENVQIAAAANDCTVHGAGYLTREDVAWLGTRGVDGVVVHYHQVPEILEVPAGRGEQDYGAVINAVKEWTDRAVCAAERRRVVTESNAT